MAEYIDTSGEVEFEIDIDGQASLDVNADPSPVEMNQDPMMIVSLTMPVPDERDQFGRPT